MTWHLTKTSPKAVPKSLKVCVRVWGRCCGARRVSVRLGGRWHPQRRPATLNSHTRSPPPRCSQLFYRRATPPRRGFSGAARRCAAAVGGTYLPLPQNISNISAGRPASTPSWFLLLSCELCTTADAMTPLSGRCGGASVRVGLPLTELADKLCSPTAAPLYAAAHTDAHPMGRTGRFKKRQ